MSELKIPDNTPIEKCRRGYTVRGLAFVQAAPFRSSAMARQLLQRFVANHVYLDLAIALRVDGVVDWRLSYTAA